MYKCADFLLLFKCNLRMLLPATCIQTNCGQQLCFVCVCVGGLMIARTSLADKGLCCLHDKPFFLFSLTEKSNFRCSCKKITAQEGQLPRQAILVMFIHVITLASPATKPVTSFHIQIHSLGNQVMYIYVQACNFFLRGLQYISQVLPKCCQ